MLAWRFCGGCSCPPGRRAGAGFAAREALVRVRGVPHRRFVEGDAASGEVRPLEDGVRPERTARAGEVHGLPHGLTFKFKKSVGAVRGLPRGRPPGRAGSDVRPVPRAAVLAGAGHDTEARLDAVLARGGARDGAVPGVPREPAEERVRGAPDGLLRVPPAGL